MNQYIKIFVLFLVVLSINSVGFAQQKENKSTKSVIVMTKAQLDSLLADIANRRKAELAKRRQAREAKFKLESQIAEMPASQKQEKSHKAPHHRGYNAHHHKMHKAHKPHHHMRRVHNPHHNDTMIFRELDLINQRINLLMREVHQISSQTKRSN
jgi:putative cell wall-binding protein